ncbi:MAG: hypothetical protein V1875_06390 [Candidatus Altiarchaeota archaeon]
MVQGVEESNIKGPKKKIIMSVLGGVATCGIFILVYVFQAILWIVTHDRRFFIFMTNLPMISFLEFLFFQFIIMTLSFYIILSSEREALKWRTPAIISSVILTITLGMMAALSCLGVFVLAISPGGGAILSHGKDIFSMGYEVIFMRTGLPIFEICISAPIFVFISSWIVFFLSGKK